MAGDPNPKLQACGFIVSPLVRVKVIGDRLSDNGLYSQPIFLVATNCLSTGPEKALAAKFVIELNTGKNVGDFLANRNR